MAPSLKYTGEMLETVSAGSKQHIVQAQPERNSLQIRDLRLRLIRASAPGLFLD